MLTNKASLLKKQGRGAYTNPAGRFELLDYELDEDLIQEDWHSKPKTQVYLDQSRSILSKNQSPDVGFEVSLNPYRGCEHGCSYCYARPTHEYLGLSAGLDFESKIFAKKKAPQLLKQTLSRPSYQAQVLAMSGVTDPYQPLERKLKITQGCLEVLSDFLHPVIIITKNALVTRDIEFLKPLAQVQAVMVLLSITSLDSHLASKLEPRASSPQARLEAINTLRQAKIPVGVMVAPLIPALNDMEIPSILKAASQAGASFAGYTCLRLPYGLKEIFAQWLDAHYPERKEKILNRLKHIKGGKLNESRFGKRMGGEGAFYDQIKSLFYLIRRQENLDKAFPRLNTQAFRQNKSKQLGLF
ncbi:MAG: PA0069 family radical SAM protein [Deltaproteobacteria bacterium]|nr:PA0069 family radical SAM protein [Deltaproteobacteria bacterium]